MNKCTNKRLKSGISDACISQRKPRNIVVVFKFVARKCVIALFLLFFWYWKRIITKIITHIFLNSLHLLLRYLKNLCSTNYISPNYSRKHQNQRFHFVIWASLSATIWFSYCSSSIVRLCLSVLLGSDVYKAGWRYLIHIYVVEPRKDSQGLWNNS